MTQEFSECLNKYTKEHHESSGKAETPEQYQVSNNENYQFNIAIFIANSICLMDGKVESHCTSQILNK